MFQLQQKVKIKWSSHFAYAIGLIASDGNISKDEKYIIFKSAEEELAKKFKTALNVKNKLTMIARGGEKRKKYFQLQIGDKIFCKFLNGLGITSAKSKTIQSVNVPNNFLLIS